MGDDPTLDDALRFHQAGQVPKAERAYRRLLEADPGDAQACHWLGMLLFSTRPEEALVLLKRSIELSPRVAEFHNNLAAALGSLGRTAEAIGSARGAIELDPGFAPAWHTLAVALQRSGQYREALDAFDRLLRLRPGDFTAHTLRGNVLWKIGRPEDSVAAHRHAIELNASYGEAYRNLAMPLSDLGRLDELLACSRRAAELMPHSAATYSNLLFALHYDPRSAPQSLLDEAVEWGRRHGRPASPAPASRRGGPGDARLRIGYLSPDFRRHTIARLIAPVLAAHDRGQFEVYCYSAVAVPDDETQRLRSLADHWRDVASMPDDAVAGQIRRDEIDILVDLAGHMGGSRMTVLAQRPAPVQIQLGYAGTTGLAAIDFRITDAHCDPPGLTERYHTEQLIRLPECAWLYEPDNAGIAVAPLPADSAGRVTFASMNKLIKVTDEALALWSQILTRVAGSKLLILAGSAGPRNHALRGRLDRVGIDGSRVELAGTLPRRQYLELFNRVDVVLDTFPYNGDTTTCDALWMGAPVVSLAGNSFVSRRGVSHLANVGLSDLISVSPADYVARAAGLASDLSQLRSIRASLRERFCGSPLVDARAYTRHLEGAYVSASTQHGVARDPQPARPININQGGQK